MRPQTIAIALSLSSLLIACGGSDDAGADAGYDENPCGFSERYLPFEAGYSWTYRVTSTTATEIESKSQELTAATDPDLGEVIVQTTAKAKGTTVSMFKVENDAVVRLRQEDRDATGALKKTTDYDPGQVRLDESSAHLVLGAEWDSVYEAVETDPVGTELSRGMVSDHWTVLGVDVDCSSPLGNFKCLQVGRERTAGGLSDKQYFFAKGIGKVKEVNDNQIEELVGCK